MRINTSEINRSANTYHIILRKRDDFKSQRGFKMKSRVPGSNNVSQNHYFYFQRRILEVEKMFYNKWVTLGGRTKFTYFEFCNVENIPEVLSAL